MARDAATTSQLWTSERGASIEGVARQLDIYGALQATMVQLAGGVFLTAYALSLGADPLTIAALAALPLAAKLSQLVTSAHIERAGHWPRTALVCGALARLLLLAAAAIPLFVEGPLAARALVVAIALSSFAASFFDLALLTWMAELVPPGVRGRFLGNRNRISGIAGQVTALLAAIAVERMSHGVGRSPLVYAGLVFVAGAIGLAALPILARVPPPRRTQSRVELPPLRTMLTTPLRDGNFRAFLWFAVLWHVALGMSNPFIIVFMLQVLHLSIFQVTVLSALNATVAAASMAYWGRLGDHFGTKTVLRVGTYLITIPTLLWLFVSPERVWPVVIIQIVTGFGWGAYNTNVNNMVLKIAPDSRGPSYVATLGAVAGGAEAIGPIVGGILLSTMRGWTGSEILPYYVIFALTFALRAAATVVPGHVHEEGGVAVGQMVRTMARFRSMNVEEAFSPLFTHVYTHVARIADFIAREPALTKRQRA